MPLSVLGLVLGGLGQDAARVLGALALGALLALLLAVAVPLQLLGLAAPAGSLGPAWTLGDLPRVDGARLEDIPPDQLAAMQRVAAASSCGLGWQVLAGVASVESGFGRVADQFSSAGAYGYGQFMEGTWNGYANGVPWRTTDPAARLLPVDRRPDSTNFNLALPVMDRYLCALARMASVGAGPADDLRRALFRYSHRADTPFDPADAYVVRVLALAAAYDRGASAGPSPGPPGAPSSQALAVARRYLGVPYVFGGTNPAVGLDCSGLVQLVYGQLGVHLPRTAQLQYDSTQRIGDAELQPGDLVFFARTYPDPHDWITHVGLYEGGGRMINAPTEHDVVREMPVFAGFWGTHYAGAGRVRAIGGGGR
jgi:cell wall-associated NlpC family hydrolase